MNARFWVYWHGCPVKLTLKPGQRVEYHESHPTDEGWAAEGETLEFDGEFVHREWVNDGADCDGRLTRGGRLKCHVLDLQRYDNHGHDVKRSWPCWQKVEDFPVYDQYAQAANY